MKGAYRGDGGKDQGQFKLIEMALCRPISAEDALIKIWNIAM